MTDLVIKSSIQETTTSTGPGTLDLDGLALGWNRFRTFFPDNDYLVYVRRNASGSKQQLIRGQLTYGTGAGGRDQLSVVNVLASTDGGAAPTAIDWVSGDNPCAVFCAPAEDLLDSAIRNHFGDTLPPWVKQALWVAKGSGVTARKLNWRDANGDDIEIATINETANTVSYGQVVLPGNPTAALQAAPKQYVDQGDRQRIWGLTYANAADATNDITVAIGGASDSTGADWLLLASALTKRLDANWAVGNDQGGILSGSAADVDYNIWLIKRVDTGVVDVGFETTANATPTLPSDYTLYRKIGWFKRASGAIVAFKTYETAGGGLDFIWTTPRRDVNSTSQSTTRTTPALSSVPQNFSTKANVRVVMFDASATFYLTVSNPDETDAAPSGTDTPGASLSNEGTTIGAATEMSVRTSATGTIAARAGPSGTLDSFIVVTRGFEWSRR